MAHNEGPAEPEKAPFRNQSPDRSAIPHSRPSFNVAARNTVGAPPRGDRAMRSEPDDHHTTRPRRRLQGREEVVPGAAPTGADLTCKFGIAADRSERGHCRVLYPLHRPSRFFRPVTPVPRCPMASRTYNLFPPTPKGEVISIIHQPDPIRAVGAAPSAAVPDAALPPPSLESSPRRRGRRCSKMSAGRAYGACVEQPLPLWKTPRRGEGAAPTGSRATTLITKGDVRLTTGKCTFSFNRLPRRRIRQVFPNPTTTAPVLN